IKQNFVGFDVIVDPRNFYRFGMGIEKTRRERADNVSANLKRLMDRGRLMNRAGDRFEILGVKRERINVSIPADNIERMMRHGHARPAGSIFHQNLGVPFLVDWIQLGRSVKVAFGIRRAHLNLTFAIQIAFRNPDRSGRFENKISSSSTLSGTSRYVIPRGTTM